MATVTYKHKNGVEFLITPFAFERGTRIYHKLIKVLSPVLSELMQGLGQGDMDANVNFGSIGSALQMVTSQVDENQLLALIDSLLESTQVKLQNARGDVIVSVTEPGAKDQAFKNPLEVYPLIIKVIEVNFGDFLSEALSTLSQKTTPMSSEQRDD